MSEEIDHLNYSGYMHEFLEDIINKHGSRGPTSEEEAKAGEDIYKEMSRYTDDVSKEEFNCHPKAFLGWIKFTVPLYMVSVFIYFLFPSFVWLSVIFSVVAFFLFFEQFLCYAEFIDPLFPEGSSFNIVGKFEPENEKKNTLIFSGHHDSAYQFNLIAWFSRFYPVIMAVAMVGVFVLPIVSSLSFGLDLLFPGWVVTQYFFTYAPWFFVVTLPFAFLFFFFETGEPVPGAMDNMSSVSIILGLAKYLDEARNAGDYLENTEILCVSFGCEEAGLRGSRRFVEKHLDELTDGKEVKLINMDGIADPNQITIVKRENTTRTDHSMELAERVKEIGKQKLGMSIPLEDMSIGGGGTDAAPFSWEGIPAISIFGVAMSPMPDYYHTSRDTPEKVKPEALSQTLDLCVEIIKDAEKSAQR